VIDITLYLKKHKHIFSIRDNTEILRNWGNILAIFLNSNLILFIRVMARILYIYIYIYLIETFVTQNVLDFSTNKTHAYSTISHLCKRGLSLRIKQTTLEGSRLGFDQCAIFIILDQLLSEKITNYVRVAILTKIKKKLIINHEKIV